MTIELNDWRLTAYALGELDAAERAAVEAALQNSPAAMVAVDDIRATAMLLERELAVEVSACGEHAGQISLNGALAGAGVLGGTGVSPLHAASPATIKFAAATGVGPAAKVFWLKFTGAAAMVAFAFTMTFVWLPELGNRRGDVRDSGTLAFNSAGTVACCFEDGSCQVLTSAECEQVGGMTQELGSVCAPGVCPLPDFCQDGLYAQFGYDGVSGGEYAPRGHTAEDLARAMHEVDHKVAVLGKDAAGLCPANANRVVLPRDLVASMERSDDASVMEAAASVVATGVAGAKRKVTVRVTPEGQLLLTGSKNEVASPQSKLGSRLSARRPMGDSDGDGVPDAPVQSGPDHYLLGDREGDRFGRKVADVPTADREWAHDWDSVNGLTSERGSYGSESYYHAGGDSGPPRGALHWQSLVSADFGDGSGDDLSIADVGPGKTSPIFFTRSMPSPSAGQSASDYEFSFCLLRESPSNDGEDEHRIQSDIASASNELSGTTHVFSDTDSDAGDFDSIITAAPNRISVIEDRIARARFAEINDNQFESSIEQPLSTFSIDVDTASYAIVRRSLLQGQLPDPSAVRLEEMVNYFPYDYDGPSEDDVAADGRPTPFAARVEIADCPWTPGHRLARIAMKGRELADAERSAANLVFLVDVSGSMQQPERLPLVQQSLRMLVGQLEPADRVAVVVYAGASGLVLPSTPARQAPMILAAIDNLQAGGSTNGGAGIELAYNVAAENFIEGGINRVILATDGDFNVGTVSREALETLITEKAKSGVFLSVLGYGYDSPNDATLETLADKGNGNYAYIDTLNEARKVLVEQLAGTLITIAKDVKIQVEFNPAVVAGYRLIGYENRKLAARDFNDDKKDAGEIGAGHAVTALYELVMQPSPGAVAQAPEDPMIDPLKYQTPMELAKSLSGNTTCLETLTLKLRYKQPEADESTLIEIPVFDTRLGFDETSDDFRFAAAVANFGMQLRQSPYRGEWTVGTLIEWAESSLGEDEYGYRAEFVELAKRAEQLGLQ